MKRFLITYVVTLLFVGCNKDNVFNCSVQSPLDQSETIPPDEALLNLKSFVNSHNKTVTKSSEILDFDVRNIEAVGAEELSLTTKSHNSENVLPDTLFYIANFSDGYAILPGSRKLDDNVYCLTESGELHAEDFNEAYDFLNSSVKYGASDGNDEFLEMGSKIVPAILLSAILNEYHQTAVTKSNYTDTDVDADGNLKTEETLSGTKIGPFLKTKWTNAKIPPFNTYTPNNAYPGCVAIAVAQIMEYNRKSNTMVFNGVTCDWDIMESVYKYDNIKYAGNEEAKKQVGNFIYEIGKKRNCYVRYDNGSWAVADGAKRTFKNYGYNNVDKRIGFASGDKKKVKSQISAGRPVYMSGCSSGSTSEGHAWVIDGMLGDYFHINWGWRGQSDGYYKIGVFTTSNRSAVDSEIDAEATGTVSGAYTWTYRIVLYSL